MERRERIVILGAGFGGLTAAVRLSKRLMPERAEVTVVDRQTHHLYRPWLYEVATGDAGEERLKAGVATPFEDLRAHLAARGVRVEYQEILGLDRAAQAVTLADGRALPFDRLIVAIGAVPDLYGIEGLERHGHPMYGLRDALVINRRLRELVERKRRGEIPAVRVLVGGAGPTGVEFACEAAMFLRSQERRGALAASEWSVGIVEASPRPLPVFHPELSGWAKERLERLGVKLHLDCAIKAAQEGSVTLAPRALKPGETADALTCDFQGQPTKDVAADLLVWCGGFRANPTVTALGLAVDARGRIEVDATMKVKGEETVWAVGDGAALVDPATSRPVPQLAQAAIHQAETAAENVARSLEDGTPVAYAFPRMHALVPMGGSWGVAEVYGVRFRGHAVWPIRLAADVRYFLKTLPWASAWKLIAAPLTSFRRNNL